MFKPAKKANIIMSDDIVMYIFFSGEVLSQKVMKL